MWGAARAALLVLVLFKPAPVQAIAMASDLTRACEALELPVVLDALAARTRTQRGAHMARSAHARLARLAASPVDIAAAYAPTAEALALLHDEGPLPPLPPIGADAALGAIAADDAALGLAALQAIAQLCTAVHAAYGWGASDESSRRAPALAGLARVPWEPHADERPPLISLHAALDGAIEARTGGSADTAVADQLSDQLWELSAAKFPDIRRGRERVAALAAERDARAAELVRTTEFRERTGGGSALAEVEGRLAVRMAPTNKSAVGRTVRVSRSGASVLVEPRALRAQSDALAKARAELAEAEGAAVAALATLVRAHARELSAAADALAELDLCLARARLGLSWGGRVPHAVGEEGVLCLREVRNPALEALRLQHPRSEPPLPAVVGHDVALGPPARGSTARAALVLSGVNGGGKTALLKSVGLIALLVRMGVPLPAGAHAELDGELSAGAVPVPGAPEALQCGRVDCFASILTDLPSAVDSRLVARQSTFMAKLHAHRRILEACAADGSAEPATSLVLLDELGCSGSEPTTAAALAVATLEALLNATADADARVAGAHSRVRTVCTTHAHELKLFALARRRGLWRDC